MLIVIVKTWKEISSAHKRETYRILKHEALKQNNKVEALKFHVQEMEVLWKEKWVRGGNTGDKMLLSSQTLTIQ